MSDDVKPAPGSSENEFIKDASNYLRGTIAKGLVDPITGGSSSTACTSRTTVTSAWNASTKS